MLLWLLRLGESLQAWRVAGWGPSVKIPLKFPHALIDLLEVLLLSERTSALAQQLCHGFISTGYDQEMTIRSDDCRPLP